MTQCYKHWLGSIPRTQLMAHNHLELQSQGFQHTLLVSTGTRHISGSQTTCRQNTQICKRKRKRKKRPSAKAAFCSKMIINFQTVIKVLSKVWALLRTLCNYPIRTSAPLAQSLPSVFALCCRYHREKAGRKMFHVTVRQHLTKNWKARTIAHIRKKQFQSQTYNSLKTQQKPFKSLLSAPFILALVKTGTRMS